MIPKIRTTNLPDYKKSDKKLLMYHYEIEWNRIKTYRNDPTIHIHI